jgi:hypothetical protein
MGLVTLVASVFYLFFAANSVQESDGAELALMAIKQAALHPPGYPLYSLLSQPLVWFFSENPYATLARFSAILQGASVGLMFWFCFRLTKQLSFSFAISVAFAIFYPALRIATDTEVFALQSFLLLALLNCCAKAFDLNESVQKVSVFLMGLFFGLCASNHHTVILWAPLLVGIFLERQVGTNLKHWVQQSSYGLVGLLLGLSPYLYLVWCLYNPESQGFISITSWSSLWAYILRSGYGTFSLQAQTGLEESYFFHALYVIFLGLPVPLIIAAFSPIWLVRFKRYLLVGIGGTLLMHTWFLSNLIFEGNSDLHGQLLARFYALVGIFPLFMAVVWYVKTRIGNFPVLKYLLITILVIPSLVQISSSIGLTNAKQDQVVAAEISLLLESLPPRSIYISTLDRLSSGLPYTQLKTGQRKDLVVVVAGLLKNSEYRANLQKTLDFNLSNNPRSLQSAVSELVEAAEKQGRFVYAYPDLPIADDLKFYASGIAWQVVPATRAITRGAVLRNIFSVCARIPENIRSVSVQRINSLLVLERVFALPIRFMVPSSEMGSVGSLLKAITIPSAVNPDSTEIRQYCIKSWGDQTDLGLPVKPY